jgi:hypothetical protein
MMERKEILEWLEIQEILVRLVILVHQDCLGQRVRQELLKVEMVMMEMKAFMESKERMAVLEKLVIKGLMDYLVHRCKTSWTLWYVGLLHFALWLVACRGQLVIKVEMVILVKKEIKGIKENKAH